MPESKDDEMNASKEPRLGPSSKQLPSSPGDAPREVFPKDIGPEHASWADRATRNISAEDPDQRNDALLDEAVDETFPASDPVSVSTEHADAAGIPSECELAQETLLDEAIEMTFPASDPIAINSCEQFARERRANHAEPYHPPA